MKQAIKIAKGLTAVTAVVTAAFVISIVFLVPLCIKLMAWSEVFWGLE